MTKKIFLIAALAVVLSPAGRVLAQFGPTVATWNDTSGGYLWSSSDNWLGGNVPEPGSALTFIGSYNIFTNNNFAPGTSFAGIAYNPESAPLATIGNALTLTGRGENTVTGQWAILDNSTGSQAIYNDLILDGSLTIEKNSSEGTLYLYGDIVNDGAQTLTVTDGSVHGNGGDVYIGGAISGSGALTKTGAEGSTLYLAGANTYTGETTVSNSGYGSGPGANNGGIINISNASALGSTAAGTTVEIGATLEIQNNIAVGDEALNLSGNGAFSGGALRNVSGDNSWAGQITLDHAARINSDSGILTLTGGITGSHALTFGGAGDILVESDIATGAGSLTKDGSGILALGAYNTYTGSTTINDGTVIISSIRNVGAAASSLGAPTLVSNGTISLGAATLKYAGTGNTTNRVIDLSADGGTAAIDQSGTGLLKFTSDLTSTGAGSKTLLLTGSTRGTGEISGAIVDNSSTNKTSLKKEGTGTWTLSGANTYTGATTVSDGTLILNTDLTDSSDLNFDSTGTGGHGGLAILGEGHTITAGITNTSGTNETGNLTFEGNGTVNGNIGSDISGLYTVNAAGVAGTTVTINGEVYAADMSVGAGTLDLDGTFHNTYEPTTLKFLADGFVILEDTHSIEHNITTANDGEGTLSFKGSGSVLGTIGAADAYLKAITVVQNSNSVNLDNSVYVNTLAFGPETEGVDATVTFGSDAHIGQGAAGQGITTQWNGYGIVAFNGDATVNGDIGSDTAGIWKIHLGTADKTLNLQGDTFVETDEDGGGIYFNNTGQTINVAADKSVTADLHNASGFNGEGTLIFLGSSTYNGGIGDSINSLNNVNISGIAGTTVTINGNIYSDDVTVGAGNLLLNGNLTSRIIDTLVFAGDGYVTLADGHTISANVATENDHTGTLNFSGDGTVNGSIGNPSYGLNDVNLLGVTGTSVTVNGDLYAYDVSIGGGKLLMNGNLTSNLLRTVNFAETGGELILADGHTIRSNITTAHDGGGTLTFEGDGSVYGNIGAGEEPPPPPVSGLNRTRRETSPVYVEAINAALGGYAVDLHGDVYSNTLNFTGAGDDSTVSFFGDAHIGQGAAGQGITTASDNRGIVVFGQDATINGTTGAADKRLAGIQLGGNQATFNGDVYTGQLGFDSAATSLSSATFNAGAFIGTGGIVTANDKYGIVNFNANGTVGGQIGGVGYALSEINAMGIAGTTVTIHGDVYASDMSVGAGTLDLDGTFRNVAEPTTLKFTADGTVILEDGHAIEHNVTTANDGEGTLSFNGDGTVLGTIGAADAYLKTITVAQNGTEGNKNVLLNGEVYTNSLNFGPDTGGYYDTIVTFGSDAHIGQGGAGHGITTQWPGWGIVAFNGDATVNGDIGSSGAGIWKILLNTADKTLDLQGNTFVESDEDGGGIYFNNTGQTINVAAGKNVTADLYNNSDIDGEGTLIFLGSSTYNGIIGTDSIHGSLADVNITGIAGTTVTINGNIHSDDVTVGAGNLLLNGDLTSRTAKTLTYTDDGYVTLANGHTINSNIATDIDGQGTLSFEGNGTVNGNIGGEDYALKDVNLLGVTGTSVTVNGDLYAYDVAIGSGQMLMNGNLTTTLLRTVNFAQPGGELILADGHTITSNITTSNDGEGTLTFEGTGSVSGNIGIDEELPSGGPMNRGHVLTDPRYIKEINVAKNGIGDSLYGDVYTDAVHFTEEGSGSVIAFYGDASIGQGGAGHGITTVNDGNDIVAFDHNATVNGQTGAADTSLGLIQLGGDQATFNGDVYTEQLAFRSAPAGSSATFNGGAFIGTGGIATNTDGIGIVNFSTNAVVAGQIGSDVRALSEVNALGVAGTTVTINGDVYAYDMAVGAGTIDLDGTFRSVNEPTTLKFLADGKVILEDGHAIEHNVTTYNNGEGTLEFMGDGTVYGNVGSPMVVDSSPMQRQPEEDPTPKYLKAINVAQDSNMVRFMGDVYANSLNFGANPETEEGGAVVRIDGYASIGQAADDLLTMGRLGSSGRIIAPAINRLVSGGDNGAAITTAWDDHGNVYFDSNTLIDGQIGADGLALHKVDFQGNATTTATVNGDIYAYDVTVGNGHLLLNGSLTSPSEETLIFTGDGTVTVTDGHDINTNVESVYDNNGTLVFLGTSTVNGYIGYATWYPIKDVKIGDGETAGGLVTINGDIKAYTTTVDSGATLKLTADRKITGDLSLLNTLGEDYKGGTLDLEGSTLTLAGAFTQATASATIAANILHSDSYGRIVQTGSATITAGNLAITVGGYVRNNTTFTIVNADEGTGVDASALAITHNSAILGFTGIGSGTEDLEVLATRVNTYDTFAADPNAAAAGAALESAGGTATGDMLAILDLLDTMPGSDLTKALGTLVPDTNGSAMEVTKLALGQFTGAITAHQEALRTGVATGSDMKNGLAVWTQGYGSYMDQSQRELSNGYKATVWGTAFGLDLPVSDSFSAGIAYGLTRGTVRGRDNSNLNAIDSNQWTLYGTYAADSFYLDLSGAYARNTYDASRKIVVGPITRTASANHSGAQYSGYAEGGYAINYGKTSLTPLASIQYQRLQMNKYTETGADSLDLTVSHKDYNFAQTGAGLKFGGTVDTKLGKLLPELRGMCLYDWTGNSQRLVSTFNGGGASFNSTGFEPAKLSWDLGAKLTLFAKHDITIALNYDVELKQDFHAQNGYVNAKYRF